MLALGQSAGRKKEVEIVRQVQPKAVSYHTFCHFLSKAAGGRAGRQRVKSQDLVG